MLRHRERMRELQLLGVEGRRLREVIAAANCLREVVEKVEVGSWWRCVAKGQEATDTAKRSLTKCKGKQKLQNEGQTPSSGAKAWRKVLPPSLDT